jgi:hypothetical protein
MIDAYCFELNDDISLQLAEGYGQRMELGTGPTVWKGAGKWRVNRSL